MVFGKIFWLPVEDVGVRLDLIKLYTADMAVESYLLCRQGFPLAD